jgi:hypothetical protein
MKYVIGLIFAIIIGIFYYPFVLFGLVISLLFIFFELIWFLKLLKDKDGKYRGIGIMLFVIILEDFAPISSFKKIVIDTFKN